MNLKSLCAHINFIRGMNVTLNEATIEVKVEDDVNKR